MHQYSPLDRNHPTHPFTVDEATGLVVDNRDNWITRAVMQMFDPEQTDEDITDAVWERTLVEVDVTRLHKGKPLARDVVLRKVYYARKKWNPEKRATYRGKVRLGIKPDREADPLPLRQAEEALAEQIDAFLESLGLPNLDDAPILSAAELRAAHEAAAQATSSPVPPRLLLPAAAGLGKSTSLLRRLATWFQRAREQDVDFTVYYASPTIKLCEELAEFYRSLGGTCVVARGRTYTADGSEPLCGKPDQVDAFTRSGIQTSVTAAMCEAWVDGVHHTCELRTECPYFEQFNANADIQFVTHAHLFEVMARRHFGKCNLLIIDESPLNALVTTPKLIPPNELKGDEHGAIVVAAMEAGTNPWEAFEAQGIAIQDVQAKIAELKGKDKPPTILPGMNSAMVMKALDPKAGYRPNRCAYVLQKIVDEWKVRREGPIRCLSYRADHPVKSDGENTTAPMLFLRHRKKMKVLREDLPVLVLDATGDAEVLAPAIPGLQQGERIEVFRNASVIQVLGHTASMSQINGDNPLHRDEAMALERRCAKTHVTLLVGTKKAVENGLTHSHPDGATIHLGGVRGMNAYEHADCVIVAARLESTALDLESQAKALLYDDERPLYLTGQYVKQFSGYDRWFRNDDYPAVGTKVSRHPDAFIDKLRWQVCEAEIIQCIDRARWARKPSRPWPLSGGMIVLLTDIPVDGVMIDGLMPYVELVDRDRPGKRLRHAFNRLGVLPPTKKLAEVAGDDGQPLWPNQNAVKDEMKVVLKGVAGDDVKGAADAVSRVLGSQVQRYSFRVKGKRGRPSNIFAVMRSDAARYLEMHIPGYEFTDG